MTTPPNKKRVHASKKKAIRKTSPPEPQEKSFYIVGMGASAGGLEAFEKFFQNMPNDSGMGFILVPHLDPTHISLMPELIQKRSKMDVIQIKDGTEVKPNSVYIVPPNHYLGILNGKLQLLDIPKVPGPRMPIDYFFRSLAKDQGEKAICIILSGMGTDGTSGLRTIKGELGMTMIQAVDSAKYNSMPKSAIETDLVDYILPPEKMPEQLIAYAQHAVKKKAVPALQSVEGITPDALQKIFILLRNHTGHDFSAYKQNTIFRRIERRMNVNQIDKTPAYVRFLQENTIEIETLFKELLIGVTSFFRDDQAFEVLKHTVLPRFLKDVPHDYTIRAWVPGCSSGEEAYSMAILLRECTEKIEQHINIQIFATDIDSNAIDAARAGIYPASISADVNPDRLKRFFISQDNNSYRIKKDIRELLVFALQNIIKDPPFTKIDIICCRNLLIYLDSSLQRKLLPLFHYSLNPDGVLFLGSSETIGGFTDLFAPVDKKWRIFRRTEAVSGAHGLVEFPAAHPLDRGYEAEEKKPVEMGVAQLAEKTLLDHYVPPSAIINDRGDILYIHGRTGKYLEPAQGKAKWNIFDMVREGLKLEMPSAIRRATTRKNEVIYKGLTVKGNGSTTQTINLIVRPIIEATAPSGLMMVVFEDISPAKEEKSPERKSIRGKKLAESMESLKKELQYTKESLQTTIEELETANEELKSTNEELQSTNEELQSTNEELETSKEEQQSMNEELATVNSELHGKIDDLSGANNDMKNLLDATDIPTIFLDNKLCIRRFTAQATRLINFIPADVGRPVGDIVSKIQNETITEDAKAVLTDLVCREREVCTRDGSFFLMRVAPYRTTENVIDGVVVTFVDITKKKMLEERERRLADDRRLAVVLRDSNDAIMVLNFEGNILAWNKGSEIMYGYSEAEAIKMNIRDIVPKGKSRASMRFLKDIQNGKEVVSAKTVRKAKSGKILNIWLTVTKLVDDKGEPFEIATTERDFAWLAEE